MYSTLLLFCRAKFDIFHKEFVHKTDNSTISQVYLSCNFCNKSVIPLQMQQRRLYSTGGYGQNPNTVKVLRLAADSLINQLSVIKILAEMMSIGWSIFPAYCNVNYYHLYERTININ